MHSPPPDEHDQSQLESVHPQGWKNPSPGGRYNLVAVGGGSVGVSSALSTAGFGGRAALVECESWGGECLNEDCAPSKALLASARAIYRTSLGDRFGFRLPGPVQTDFAAIMGRMRHLRARASHRGDTARLIAAGVDVYYGQARFTAPNRIEVGGQELAFRRAVIATGSRPVVPEVPGVDDLDCLTSETIFALSELPRRLIVLGGGSTACELAQAFRRLGSEVHLVHCGPCLLDAEEPDVCRLLRAQFEREGIHLYLGWSTEAAEKVGDAKALVISGRGEKKKLLADAVLAAAQRRPNIEGLGLEAAGVRFSAAGVEVDDHLRTSNPAIFAAGDVCSSCKLMHATEAMARLCIQNALFLGRERLSKLVAPRCTHTDPEIAQVGLTASEAAERGIDIDTYRIELAEVDRAEVDRAVVDRAVVDGEEDGLAIVHTRRGAGRVVGGTIVAAHAGEMIGELALLVTRGLSLSTLANTIHCSATQSEMLNRVASRCSQARSTPFLTGLARRWLKWRR